MDHSFYVDFDSYVHDSIIPPQSEYCFTILRYNDLIENESFIYVWDYANNTLILKEEFEFKIESIIYNPKKTNQFIVFGIHTAGVWTFSPLKKKFVCEKILEKGLNGDIADSAFIKINNIYYSFIAFKSVQIINMYNENYEILKKFKISDAITPSSFNSNEDFKAVDDKLRILDSQRDMTSQKIPVHLHNNIKYIIIRDKTIYVFFLKTSIFFIFEMSNDLEMNLRCSQSLNIDLHDHSSIMINQDQTQLLYISAKVFNLSTDSFLGRMAVARKSIIKVKEKKDKKEKKVRGVSMNNKTSKTDILTLHEMVKCSLNFYTFKIGNGLVKLESEILKESTLGTGVTHLSISKNPKYLLTCYENKHINIFLQSESKSSETNEKGYSSSSLELHLLKSHNFENLPINASFHPFGLMFFITFKDSGHFYGILDKEIKELTKINAYCKAATFCASGCLLAFSSTIIENTGNYNITILNTSTLDIEYIIANIASYASKIEFYDNDRILVALFEDGNIYGWYLNERRYMIVPNSKNFKEPNLFLKNTDSTEKFIDVCYDHVVDYLVVLTEEKKVKIFKDKGENLGCYFLLDCVYTCIILLRKFDVIFFGTTEGNLILILGSVRSCLWPITNYTNKGEIYHPTYTEKKIHNGKITNLKLSHDSSLLYSCSDDGSIFISLLRLFVNEKNVDCQTLQYFDNKNILIPKFFMTYDDLAYLTEPIYKGKLDLIKNRLLDKQSKSNEFSGNNEKKIAENSKHIEDKRTQTNLDINKVRTEVKLLEDKKEKKSKKLRDKRTVQEETFKKELFECKNLYRQEKENYQKQTKALNNIIKEVKDSLSAELKIIVEKKVEKNNQMESSFNEMISLLSKRLNELNQMISVNNTKFKTDITKLEEDFEKRLNVELSDKKKEVSETKEIIKEIKEEKANKDKENKSNEEKIREWEKNIYDFMANNRDLEENYLYNTLKLTQLNQLLKENEKKITEKEKIIKEKRTTNDRLEQLRFVLEYQIINLKKEKEPIEKQIKKFEALHAEFNKRFNSLYNEQLEIDDCIKHNENLIQRFKVELGKKKETLVKLRNNYMNIEMKINEIVRKRFEDKVTIINLLIDCYNKYLSNFVEEESQTKISKDSRLQAKIIEKEINKQKNKVLRDLADKTEERKITKNERFEIMSKIQKENTQLIDECVSIRTNLHEILYYINDIEKKFIELTNTHVFLHKIDNTKNIKENIKMAKQTILLADVEGMRRRPEKRGIFRIN